ncbi:unnamed protein product [Protopolystoma xenopodis]|uniref:Uncharacterized protein n=1 Tax=Protopolystoma xenopodis TaxID=117903 RepID=A0A3S5BVI6_9PLAT|nr:unnamed protein product [Protopolystoma xenopodis]
MSVKRDPSRIERLRYRSSRGQTKWPNGHTTFCQHAQSSTRLRLSPAAPQTTSVHFVVASTTTLSVGLWPPLHLLLPSALLVDAPVSTPSTSPTAPHTHTPSPLAHKAVFRPTLPPSSHHQRLRRQAHSLGQPNCTPSDRLINADSQA